MNYQYIKRIFLPALAILVLVTGCAKDKRSTGIEYAPEMYHSIPLEPFTQVEGKYSPFKDKMNAQIPPEGTIAVDGHFSLDYTGLPLNMEAERGLAGKELMNPYKTEMSEEDAAKVMAKGKVLYNRFCSVCHGANGMADGPVPENGNYPPPTMFNKKTIVDLPQGEIFYNMTYGKNAMGSYASQLSVEERWMVALYVETMLKKEETDSDKVTEEEGADGENAEEDKVEEEGDGESDPADEDHAG